MGRGSSTCYSVNEALFGVNPYGEQISGMLFYKFLKNATKLAPQQSPTACQPIDPTFGFSDNDANPTRKILLVDRGTCLSAKDFKTKKNLACCEMTPGKRYDSCGNCKNITAPDFNQCYQAGITQVTTGVVGGVVAVFIVLLLVIGGVVAAAVILLKKKDQETRWYVDSVVSSYLPMEDNDDDEEDETASLNKKVEQEATL